MHQGQAHTTRKGLMKGHGSTVVFREARRRALQSWHYAKAQEFAGVPGASYPVTGSVIQTLL